MYNKNISEQLSIVERVQVNKFGKSEKKISAIVSVNIFESELWMVVKGKIRFSWSHNTLVLLRCHICNASALTVVYSDLLYLDCAPCTNCVTA